MKRPKSLIIGLLSGLIAISTAIFQYIDKVEETNRAEEYQHKFETLLIQQLDTSNRIIALQDSLIKSNYVIHYLQDEINSIITSRGNIPLTVIGSRSFSKSHYYIGVYIHNTGKTPIRGLTITITDSYSEFISVTAIHDNGQIEGSTKYEENATYNDLAKRFIKDVPIGDMPPNNYREAYFIQIPKELRQFDVPIKVQWENGYYYFTLKGIISHEKLTPFLSISGVGDKNGKLHSYKFIKVNNDPNDYFKTK